MGDTRNKTETKNTPLLTRSNSTCSSNRCWSCRNPAAARRGPGPTKARTTPLKFSWVKLRRHLSVHRRASLGACALALRVSRKSASKFVRAGVLSSVLCCPTCYTAEALSLRWAVRASRRRCVNGRHVCRVCGLLCRRRTIAEATGVWRGGARKGLLERARTGLVGLSSRSIYRCSSCQRKPSL